MVPLGNSDVTSSSTNININLKRLTEDDLIGMDNDIMMILWSKYFIDSQGYTVKQNKKFQDKKSTII